MYRYRRTIILMSTLCLIFAFSACNKLISNEKNRTSIGIETNNKDENIHNNDNQALKNFIIKYETAIENEDANAFKELIDKDGIFSITYFVDSRDSNVILHLYRDEIRDDLVLANTEKVGITLSPMFEEDVKKIVENIPIHSSKPFSDISFNVNWHLNNEKTIQSKLEDIVKICENLILTNNENIPQVFVLKDNIYAFTLSNATQEPNIECTGNWVIFEKMGKEYWLRAIIQLQ